MFKIIVPVCNNPLFIKIQAHTFKKYMKGNWEFIVYNDCKKFPDISNFNDTTLWKQIVDTCAELGITCINIDNEHHKTISQPSVRHADTMNKIFADMSKSPGKYFIIDSDMFLFDTFDIERYAQYECAVVVQLRSGHRYIWPNIFYIDMNTIHNKHLINFNVSPQCDSGGATKQWFSIQEKEYPTKTYCMKYLKTCRWDEDEVPSNLKGIALLEFIKKDPRNNDTTCKNPRKHTPRHAHTHDMPDSEDSPWKDAYFCELYEGSILHYRAGSNWRGEGEDIHSQLTQQLYDILVSK